MGLFKFATVYFCPHCKKPVILEGVIQRNICPECGKTFPLVGSMKQSKWDKMTKAEQDDYLEKVLVEIAEETAKTIKVNGEYRRKCNSCGKIWCFTDADIQENDLKAFKMKANGWSALVQTIGGSALLAQGDNAASERYKEGIVDYDKCPHCGSKDFRNLNADEWAAEQAKAAQGSAPASAVSAADELKKFKDLLDSGVITQEEFDAKKKQLLGL